MGGKTSTTTSQVQIPPEVMANYNAVNAMAKEAAANPFQTYSSDPNKFVAQMNQTQLNAMGPLNIDPYKNQYTQDVVKSTMDVVNQQNQQAQAGQLGTAISSGAFGGDRAGIAAANLSQQQQMANAQIASGLYSDAYNQALATAQQQQGFQFGAGTLQQQTDQAGLTALYNQWLQQQAYPFQTAQFLGNIAMGTGALSGSTTTTRQPYSYFKRGGAVRPGLADGGIPGPYSAPVGSIPGLAGYIPDPYLPVSDMLTADPAYSDMAQQSAADYANKIAEYGKAIQSTFFADGGTVDPRGYLGSVLDAQEKDRPGLHPAETPKSEQSGGLGDILKIAAMFMSRGGYADGGDPEQDDWEKTVEQMRANAVPPDQLNIPSGLGMARVDTAPTPGVVPPKPDLTTNAVQPKVVAPVRTTGEIVPPVDQPDAPAPSVALAAAGTPEAPADQYSLGTPVGFSTAASRVPSNWATDSSAIKQRESGGDYNAILGFSNRDGGPFQNVDLTNMTVDQAIAFSQPGGAYADYSKGRLGYVATPMGAYQIVGSTIADIKKQMGLTGNELMTPELQEAMGRHLYETRGIQPWAESMLAGGGGGGGPAGGLGDANMTTPAGVNPAYRDRNALGQIFYNPKTNKFDKNALLAVLGGIGTMASSPSRFLGSAILQGLGGFANTYAGLQKEQADIDRLRADTAASLAGTARALPGDVAAWGAMGTPVENADYASMIGFPGEVPNAVPTSPATSSAGFGADVSTPDMIRAFQSGAVGPNGIPFNQDPAFLNGLIARLSPVAGSSPNLAGVLSAAQTALSNVQATGVSYGAAPGSAVVNPALAGAANEASTIETGRALTSQFNQDAANQIPSIDQQMGNLNQQVKVYSQFEPGALTDAETAITTAAKALGFTISDDADANAAAAQQAKKYAINTTITALGGIPGDAPKAAMERIDGIAADPNLQPDAVKEILAMQMAAINWKKSFYSSRGEFNKAFPDKAYDQAAYVDWFTKTYPFEAFKDQADKAFRVKGQIVPQSSRENPVKVNSQEEYDKLPSGTWVSDGKNVGQKP